MSTKKNGFKVKKGTLGRIVRVVGKRFPLLVGALLCALTYVIISVMIPVFVGDTVDLCIGKGNVDLSEIVKVLFKIGVLTVVGGIAQYLMSLLNNRITYGVVSDLRKAAFSHIQRLPFSYLDKTAAGDTVSRVTSDAEQLGDGLLTGFTQLFTGVTTIAVTLVFMLTQSFLIAAAVVVVTPLSLVASRLVAKKTYGFFKEQASVRGEQTAFANEMISGQKTLQSLSVREETQNAFDEIN